MEAETGIPIEGAVVLVEWTKTTGLGLKSTSSYEVRETMTDQEGKFTVPGILNPFVSEPNVTIYKKGYIAWNSRIIYPDYRKRYNVEWKDNPTIELSTFGNSDSYQELMIFISSAAAPGDAPKKKKLFKKQYHWLAKKAVEEQSKHKGNMQQ